MASRTVRAGDWIERPPSPRMDESSSDDDHDAASREEPPERRQKRKRHPEHDDVNEDDDEEEEEKKVEEEEEEDDVLDQYSLSDSDDDEADDDDAAAGAAWDADWSQTFRQLAQQYGEPMVAASDLHRWVLDQRTAYTKNELAPTQAAALQALGVDLDPHWHRYIRALLEFRAEFGHLHIEPDDKYHDLRLGEWLDLQCQAFRTARPSRRQNVSAHDRWTELERLGVDFDWDWTRMWEALKKYQIEHESLQVESNVEYHGRQLRHWCYENRWLYHRLDPQGRRLLSEARVKKLVSLGFDFALDRVTSWQEGSTLNRWEADHWDDLYTGLILWKVNHYGSINVPRRYRYHGCRLGPWVHRLMRLSTSKGTACELTNQARREMLDAMGFDHNKDTEQPKRVTFVRKAKPIAVRLLDDEQWQAMLDGLKEFKVHHGYLARIPPEVEIEGESLREWVLQMQRQFHEPNPKKRLVSSRIEQLTEEGFLFQPSWDEIYTALQHYKTKYGSLDVPTKYIDARGRNLSQFVFCNRWLYHRFKDRQRQERLLGADKIEKLQAIGFDFDLRLKSAAYKNRQKRPPSDKGMQVDRSESEQAANEWDTRWNQRFTDLVLFIVEHGHSEVPKECLVEKRRLDLWMPPQRSLRGRHERELSKRWNNVDRLEKLEAIDLRCHAVKTMTEKADDQWEEMFQGVTLFKEKNGHVTVPLDFNYRGRNLGAWVSKQRLYYRNSLEGEGETMLDEERARKLKSLGINLVGHGRRAHRLSQPEQPEGPMRL